MSATLVVPAQKKSVCCSARWVYGSVGVGQGGQKRRTHRRGGASDRTSRKRQEGRAPSFWDHCHQNIGGNRNGSFIYYWAPTSASVQCVLYIYIQCLFFFVHVRPSSVFQCDKLLFCENKTKERGKDLRVLFPEFRVPPDSHQSIRQQQQQQHWIIIAFHHRDWAKISRRNSN